MPFTIGTLPLKISPLMSPSRQRTLYSFAKRAVSATERVALESGTIDFDRKILRGQPSLDELRKLYPLPSITSEEKYFLEKKVLPLCEMIDDHTLERQQDLPQKVWNFVRKQGFFGISIPQSFGGLEFTPHGHSQTIQLLATRSGSTASTVMAPSFLGPGELILKYGTTEQKNHYLPRLADGSEIPCSALAGVHSESDASRMNERAVVCFRNGILGISLTFDKPYITLAPVATVICLAIDLKDPGKLLTKGKTGITVVLLSREMDGLDIGKRHDPLSTAFMNGPVRGHDLFVPMKQVIGGQEYTGQGKEMMMQCLSEGRGVNLSTTSVASAKLACTSVGAYSRVQCQSNTAIADMERVQVNLAQMASKTYKLTAAQHLINAMLNQHEKPALLSTLMKYETTKTAREVVNLAMDILGSMGVCKGKNNFIANLYQNIPISMTLEGNNLLNSTSTMFGQKLMISIPYFPSVVNHLSKNIGTSVSQAILKKSSKNDLVGYYETQLNQLSSAFALCANLGLTIDDKLKHKEMIYDRYATIFTKLYLGYATLWFHTQQKEQKQLDVVLEHSVDTLLHELEGSFFELFDTFPHRNVAVSMRTITFPTGRCYRLPKDSLTKQVAQQISSPSTLFQTLSDGVFISQKDEDRLRGLVESMPLFHQAEQIHQSLKKEKRKATEEESVLLEEVKYLRGELVSVNEFDQLPEFGSVSLKNQMKFSVLQNEKSKLKSQIKKEVQQVLDLIIKKPTTEKKRNTRNSHLIKHVKSINQHKKQITIIEGKVDSLYSQLF